MKTLVKRIAFYALNHKDEQNVVVYSGLIASDTKENVSFLEANGIVYVRVSIDERIAKFNNIDFESFIAKQIGGVR